MVTGKKVIPPQGRRKYNIILKATFSGDSQKNKELEEAVAHTMGGMGIFDNSK